MRPGHGRAGRGTGLADKTVVLIVEDDQNIVDLVRSNLSVRGHDVIVYPPWSLGRVSAVARRGGMLYAAANPRGMQGYAVGR